LCICERALIEWQRKEVKDWVSGSVDVRKSLKNQKVKKWLFSFLLLTSFPLKGAAVKMTSLMFVLLFVNTFTPGLGQLKKLYFVTKKLPFRVGFKPFLNCCSIFWSYSEILWIEKESSYIIIKGFYGRLKSIEQ
jgi:hypothetical protein